MVNTFLVDGDFYKSAQKLDRSRLGKQRVEAKQILTTLTQLRFLADYFNIPQFPTGQDTPKEIRESWIRQVITTFKQSNLLSIHLKPKLIVEIYSPVHQPIKPKSQHELVIDDQGKVYEVKGKRRAVVSSGYPYNYVLPGEELIQNLRIHPAITMWLGFETALKGYINAHIHVWIERGYQNNMITYDVPKTYPRPNWTLSQDVIDNFKSTLVERELARNEPFWYCYQLDMVLKFTYDEYHYHQFQHIMNSLPPLILKKDGKGNPIYKNDQPTMIEPEIYGEYKKYLHQLGHFPGFIWP